MRNIFSCRADKEVEVRLIIHISTNMSLYKNMLPVSRKEYAIVRGEGYHKYSREQLTINIGAANAKVPSESFSMKVEDIVDDPVLE